MKNIKADNYNKLSNKTTIYYTHPYCPPRKWK